VEDRARPSLVDHAIERRRVDDVELAEVRFAGHARRIAGGQVVDHHHLVAFAEQRVDDV
jgi:hypothetical protein